jgi:hypothetical protein
MVKPRPNVPSAKAATEPLPASERFLFLARERLAAPLLAQSAARSQPEIEVVEDLGRLVDHGLSV